MEWCVLLCSFLLLGFVPIQADVDQSTLAALQIHKNLNRSQEACTNFWNYACGNYSAADGAKYVDNFELVEDLYAQAMVEFMEGDLELVDSDVQLNEGPALRLLAQMRAYYNACTNDSQTDWPEEDFRLLESNDWALETAKFRRHGLNAVFFDERVDVAYNDSLRSVVQLKMPDPSSSYSERCALQLLKLNHSGSEAEVSRLVDQLRQLEAKHRQEEPLVQSWTLADLEQKIPQINWQAYFHELLSGHLNGVLFEVSDVDYLRELGQQLGNTNRSTINLYLRLRLTVLLKQTGPARRSPNTCIHHMRALLPLGMNYLYNRYVYKNRNLVDNIQLLEIFESLKGMFGKYLEANRLQLSPAQLSYVREKLSTMKLKVGNLPEETSPAFYDSHYESANFSDSHHLSNVLEALSLRTRLQHDVLRLPHSRLDLRRYYVNDDVVKARTSPFYENERNTITVPLIFLHFPLFDHRQHSIFQYSLMGGVLAHELSHAFEHEGILFDADGNESPVGLQIRDTKAFQNAIKCAAQTPAVSLKERLADLNGLQLAYDTFFGLDHNSQLYTYRPYAFESEFQAPQLFHLSYAQFFCGILPPVLGHDRDDVRVNVNVANLRQFSLDFKCPPPAVQSPPVCELWRPTASSILVSA
ncbi:endothelin-converting enzyme 1-like [Drosophila guanche]|uniref:Blast:Endothelin-converting enzyme 1 n=1 Tax=Drosophila guanche TaxID=7266 RepID=A0A3B0K7U5_DROGU|nr:endothelin-converting enzyme 1-like [Drosophila guanche]SPP90154.1 blast:Endothelin-converting enzyme 1 [Drosophila guanche]